MVYWNYIVYALRHDTSIERHVDKFNSPMVKFASATHKQVDWVHKTTYVSKLDITTKASDTINKYLKGTTQSHC